MTYQKIVPDVDYLTDDQTRRERERIPHIKIYSKIVDRLFIIKKIYSHDMRSS